MPRIPSFLRVTLVSAALLVAALASPAFSGAATPVGAPVATQQQLTTFPSPWNGGCCAGPSIAHNPTSGKTLAAWLEEVPVSAQAPNGAELRTAFVGSDAAFSSTPSVVSTTLFPGNNNQWMGGQPAIAPGPNGTWLVVWVPYMGYYGEACPGKCGPLYGQILDSNGNASGPNLTISSRTDWQEVVSISAAWSPQDQRYLVTWTGGVPGDMPGAGYPIEVNGRFLDSVGAGIGDDFLVTNSADGIDDQMDMAYGNGRWVVVAKTKNNRRVVGQVVTAAGPQGGWFDLSSGGAAKIAPSIAYNEATRQFAAVFRSAPNPGPEFMRLMDSSGSPIGADIDLGATGNRPRIASAGSLGYLVSWHRGTGWFGTIYGLRVQADGTVSGPPAAMSTDLPFQSARPDVAFDASSGRFLTVFWGAPNGPNAGNINVYARPWGQLQERVTVTPDGDGKGRITSSPAGIDCGSVCSALFDVGSSVTLTVTPEPGYVFAGWGGACSGTEPTCTVTADAANSVTAKFEKAPPGPTPGPTPSNAFQVRTPLLIGTGIRSLVRVPGAGVIRQAGTFRSGGKTRRACGSGSRAVSAAGTYRFRCRLSDAVRAARRKGAVRVRLVTTYTPTGGTARVVVRTVVLRSLKPKFTG